MSTETKTNTSQKREHWWGQWQRQNGVWVRWCTVGDCSGSQMLGGKEKPS